MAQGRSGVPRLCGSQAHGGYGTALTQCQGNWWTCPVINSQHPGPASERAQRQNATTPRRIVSLTSRQVRRRAGSSARAAALPIWSAKSMT